MRFQSFLKYSFAIVTGCSTFAQTAFPQTVNRGSSQPVQVIDQNQDFQKNALSSINWARTKPSEVAAYLEKEMLPLFYTDQPTSVTVNRVDSNGNAKKVTEMRYPRYASVQEIRGGHPELFKSYTDAQIIELRRFYVETSGKPLNVEKMRAGSTIFRALSDDEQVVGLFQTLGQVPYVMNSKEGKAVVLETIQFLKTQTPLKPLSWNDYLAQKAKEMVLFSGALGAIGHEREDGTAGWKGYEEHGLGCIGENLAYGQTDLTDAVVGLIVDDGIKDRGHRLNVYSKEFTDVGVAMGEHRSRYNIMCVQDFGCSADSGLSGSVERNPQIQNRPMMSPQNGAKQRAVQNMKKLQDGEGADASQADAQ